MIQATCWAKLGGDGGLFFLNPEITHHCLRTFFKLKNLLKMVYKKIMCQIFFMDVSRHIEPNELHCLITF